MLWRSPLSHPSKIVRGVTTISLLSAGMLLILAFCSHRPEFPGLRHLLPIWPWLVGAAVVSALSALAPWYARGHFIFAPILGSLAVIAVMVAARFWLAPILWLNVLAIIVVILWQVTGRGRGGV
jgi:hypothetical protein